MAPVLNEENDTQMRARLVSSLNQSFPSSALSKALYAERDENVDPLSSSCFTGLCQPKLEIQDDLDEELTSLTWLQDANLLKNIAPADGSNHVDGSLCKKEDIEDDKLPLTVMYDPVNNAKGKPPYSFSCLIFMAIEASTWKRLPVKDIYEWIVARFPYFRSASSGWRNSVRHNLSLNKCFKKVERDQGQGLGKGSSWCIDPNYRPNLLQALRRTPYHPFQQIQMMSSGPVSSSNDVLPIKEEDDLAVQAPQTSLNKISPDLFPYLSRRLAQANVQATDDYDVADTLANLSKIIDHYQRPLASRYVTSKGTVPQELGSERDRQIRKLRALKNLSKLVCQPIISSDHTYSLPEYVLEEAQNMGSSSSSSVDGDLDFGSSEEVESMDTFSESATDGNETSEKETITDSTETKPETKPGRSSNLLPMLAAAVENEEESKRLVGIDALLDLASGLVKIDEPKNSGPVRSSERKTCRFTLCSALHKKERISARKVKTGKVCRKRKRFAR